MYDGNPMVCEAFLGILLALGGFEIIDAPRWWQSPQSSSQKKESMQSYSC